MTEESVKDFYNRQYSLHRDGQILCPNALHDLAKANRRVADVVRGFSMSGLRGASILDVGSGLGFYTKALSLAGADVTGIDFSEAAVDTARATFPDCRFDQAAWPDNVEPGPAFDVIWMVNFSLMNTFDVGFIKNSLIDPAMQRLRAGGSLVIGWNSNFSGRMIDGYSHWPFAVIDQLRGTCGLSRPLVPGATGLPLSWLVMRCAAVVGRSIPIFMVKMETSASGTAN